MTKELDRRRARNERCDPGSRAPDFSSALPPLHPSLVALHRSRSSLPKLEEPLVPPLRFALFAASPLASAASQPALASSPLYRGSLPKPHNLEFLSTLSLKTVVSLSPKSIKTYEDAGDLPSGRRGNDESANASGAAVTEGDFTRWAQRRKVNIVHVKVGNAKDGAIPFTPATVKQVLELLVNKTNYPIYIHDLDGSDVLAIMGAALRKLQGWSERAWTEEMSRYLRQPPAEPEHLLFLRRLLPPNSSAPPLPPPPPPHSSSAATPSATPDGIVVPKPSLRVPWLWPQGFPGKKGVHMSMKVVVEVEPMTEEEVAAKNAIAAGATAPITGGGGVGSSGRDREGEGKRGRGEDGARVTDLGGKESRSRSGESELGGGTRSGSAEGGKSSERDRSEAEDEVDGRLEEGEEDVDDDGDVYDQEDDDEEDFEDEDVPLSKTIEALDLGL